MALLLRSITRATAAIARDKSFNLRISKTLATLCFTPRLFFFGLFIFEVFFIYGFLDLAHETLVPLSSIIPRAFSRTLFPLFALFLELLRSFYSFFWPNS